MFYALLASLFANFGVISSILINRKINKKKANAEAELSEIDVNLKELTATEKIIEIYNKLNVDLKVDYDRRIDLCNIEINEMKKEMLIIKINECLSKDCSERIKRNYINNE